MRLHTGWGKGNRPFSPTEFKNSRLKRSFKGLTYEQYLKSYKKYEMPKKRKTVKKRPSYGSYGGFW